ncbi:helix-turn-helix domain-containing protein [Streptomyces sp. NPDC087908]|uniref:helix-turn-helix domain-containing protein n=1 Tax=Streptomyces sp. NPDC087908 TaxID=3365820 RepID=UPI00382A0ADC
MPASPSSSAQTARQAVARRLRELRQDAGLTLVQLAGICGWSHSKPSRIENAKTPPSPSDIAAWCRACTAEDQAADLTARSRDVETMYREWRKRARTGLRQLQNDYLALFHATRLFRVYSPTAIPGLLQTQGYTRALLAANARLLNIPDDSAAAATARTDRSRIIHQPGRRRFAFILEESALRYQLGTSDDMAAQLGHLLTAGALPAVSLGIIPTSAPRTLWPQETFHLYDNTLASIELLTAEINITTPTEITLYETAFEELRTMAVYGPTARTLILNAIHTLPHTTNPTPT